MNEKPEQKSEATPIASAIVAMTTLAGVCANNPEMLNGLYACIACIVVLSSGYLFSRHRLKIADRKVKLAEIAKITDPKDWPAPEPYITTSTEKTNEA